MMGRAAAEAALINAQMSPDRLDAAIVFSGMPDFVYPKDGNAILHALGATNAACWNLDTACASFITGLEAARLRILGGGATHVLVLMIMSWVNRGIDRSGDFSAVGDGAAAVIVSRDQEHDSFVGIREATHGEHFGYLELPSPFAAPTDSAGDSISQSRLPAFSFGEDPKHGRFLMSACLQPAKQLLAETDTLPESVDWFLAHQPGTRLPKIWARGLGIAPERLLSTYGTCANLSAVNIPMTLAHFAGGVCQWGEQTVRSQSKIKRGDRVLFFAPGAGLHVAASLWIW